MVTFPVAVPTAVIALVATLFIKPVPPGRTSGIEQFLGKETELDAA